MSRTGLALAVVLFSGCTTITQEGAVQSIAPFKHRCADHQVRAGLVKANPNELELSATSSGVCQDGEVRTVKVEQYSESWVPAGIVGILVGSIIEVPVLIATFWLAGKAGSNVSNLGDAAWVVILPGIVVGGAVTAALGSTRFRLLDGEPRQVEVINASNERLGASEGFVVLEADPSLKFPLVDGKARLPIDQVWSHDLGRLLVNGVLVELDEASRPLATELSTCRRAVHKWKLGAEGTCDDELARLTWAKACHVAGYSYADQVLARLQTMGCQ